MTESAFLTTLWGKGNRWLIVLSFCIKAFVQRLTCCSSLTDETVSASLTHAARSARRICSIDGFEYPGGSECESCWNKYLCHLSMSWKSTKPTTSHANARHLKWLLEHCASHRWSSESSNLSLTLCLIFLEQLTKELWICEVLDYEPNPSLEVPNTCHTTLTDHIQQGASSVLPSLKISRQAQVLCELPKCQSQEIHLTTCFWHVLTSCGAMCVQHIAHKWRASVRKWISTSRPAGPQWKTHVLTWEIHVASQNIISFFLFNIEFGRSVGRAALKARHLSRVDCRRCWSASFPPLSGCVRFTTFRKSASTRHEGPRCDTEYVQPHLLSKIVAKFMVGTAGMADRWASFLLGHAQTETLGSQVADYMARIPAEQSACFSAALATYFLARRQEELLTPTSDQAVQGCRSQPSKQSLECAIMSWLSTVMGSIYLDVPIRPVSQERRVPSHPLGCPEIWHICCPRHRHGCGPPEEGLHLHWWWWWWWWLLLFLLFFIFIIIWHWTYSGTYVLVLRVSLRLFNLDCRYPRDQLQPARKKKQGEPENPKANR